MRVMMRLELVALSREITEKLQREHGAITNLRRGHLLLPLAATKARDRFLIPEPIRYAGQLLLIEEQESGWQVVCRENGEPLVSSPLALGTCADSYSAQFLGRKVVRLALTLDNAKHILDPNRLQVQASEIHAIHNKGVEVMLVEDPIWSGGVMEPGSALFLPLLPALRALVERMICMEDPAQCAGPHYADLSTMSRSELARAIAARRTRTRRP